MAISVRKKRWLIGGGLLLAALAYTLGRDRSSAPNSNAELGSAAARLPVQAPNEIPVGSLLSTGETSPAVATGIAAKAAGESPETVIRNRMAKVAVDPKLESAMRSSSDPATGEILLYLRARKGRKDLTADEFARLNASIQENLLKNPEGSFSLIGRALTAIESSPENRQDRLDLLSLVGGFPAAENSEINRSALAALGEQYAGGTGASGDEGFSATVTSVQAYLATTRANATTANAVLVQAMGGKIDPAVREVYQNLFSDRYPAPPRR